MLRNHRNDFGVSQENLAHFSRGRLAVFERERGRHGSANPKIAFFQVRKKLAAQSRRYQQEGSNRKGELDSHHESAVSQRKTQRRIVKTVQQADDDRFGFLQVLREQHGSEHGRDGERCNQGSGQRVAISARHGAEDLTLDSLHGEERHETGHGDERRE